MLTKEHTSELVIKHFEIEGYQQIVSYNPIDLMFQKQDEVLKVMVLSAVNDASSTSKKGKGFNKNQAKMNIALVLFECIKDISQSQTHNRYVIAVPDNSIFGKVVNSVLNGLERLDIRVLMVSEHEVLKYIN